MSKHLFVSTTPFAVTTAPASQCTFTMLQFSAGWWVLIDGYGWGASQNGCVGNKDMVNATQGYAWLPLLGATLVFVMINGMKWSELRDDGLVDSKAAVKARIFLLFALFIACGSLAGSGFIMADK